MKYKYNGEWKELVIKASDTLPIGAIVAFAGETPPTGWLFCNGTETSRSKYPELFKVIGTTYGDGDGETTFNLPDANGRALVGRNWFDDDFNVLGKTGGEKTHTLTVNEMPKHKHNMFPVSAGSSGPNFPPSGVWADATSNRLNDYTSEVGGDQAHNNLQPYIVTNYIIKASQTTPITGQIENSLDSNSTTAAPSIKAVKDAITESITDALGGSY